MQTTALASHYHLSNGREGIYSLPSLGIGASEGSQAFGLVCCPPEGSTRQWVASIGDNILWMGLSAADLLPLTSMGIQGETPSDTGVSKNLCTDKRQAESAREGCILGRTEKRYPFDRNCMYRWPVVVCLLYDPFMICPNKMRTQNISAWREEYMLPSQHSFLKYLCFQGIVCTPYPHQEYVVVLGQKNTTESLRRIEAGFMA